MIINTQDFGPVEISKEDIIRFPEGLYAFPDIKEYVILKNKENPIMRLQPVHRTSPRFILIDPFCFVKEYKPSIPQPILTQLGASNADELTLFSIAVIPLDLRQSTVNLKSPLIVCFEKKAGIQAILEDVDFPVDYPLFPDDFDAEAVKSCW